MDFSEFWISKKDYRKNMIYKSVVRYLFFKWNTFSTCRFHFLNYVYRNVDLYGFTQLHKIAR